MSRKKRQTVTLLVLCLVLIAAGVGYYALIRHQAAQEKAEKVQKNCFNFLLMILTRWSIREKNHR